MTPGGWATFIISISSVTALFGWCIYKVLTSKKPEKMYGADMFDEFDPMPEPPKRRPSGRKARRRAGPKKGR